MPALGVATPEQSEGGATAPPLSYGWTLGLLILSVVAGRALMSVGWLPATGAGFGDTEAYYASWSMDPMLGYHDHPGLLAWLLAGARLVGTDVASQRLVPLVLFSLTLVIGAVYWRRVSGDRSALLAVVAFSAIPIYGTGALLIAPDGPLAVAWIAALLCTELAERSSPRWWWAAAACGGLAVASKWMGGAVVLALLVEIWRGRRSGRWPLVVIVLGFAVAGALPSLLFELSHDFSGLRYHLAERHSGVPFAPGNWLRFVAGHLLAVSPVLAVLVWGALARPGLVGATARAATFGVGARHRDGSRLPQGRSSRRRAWRMALAFFVPTALISVFTAEAEPHWPVLAYLPLLGPLAAATARRPRLYAAAIVVGVGLQALVWAHLAHPFLVRALPEDYERRADLVGDLHGWDSVAEQARDALGRGDVQRVAANHYTLCGQLSARLGLEPLACLSDRRDAYDFLLDGGTGRAPVGVDLLFVRDNRYVETGPELICCRAWEPERTVEARRGGVVVHSFGLQVCRGYLGPDNIACH